MTPRFVPPDGPSRAIETQLRSLDPFLRATVGPAATIEPQCNGAPGRTIALQRDDHVTVALTVVPLLVDPSRGDDRPYLISLTAWTDAQGQRHHWRNGPEWTISLAGEAERRAAERIIAQAWETARTIDRARILPRDGQQGTIGGK